MNEEIIEKVLQKVFEKGGAVTTDTIRIDYLSGKVSPKDGWISTDLHRKKLIFAMEKALAMKDAEQL